MTVEGASDLHLEQLSAGYRGRPVISNLTLLPIKAGQVTALVGPNAAGKTTLLRAMAGLLPATGEVRLRGRNILGMPAAERAELVSYMPQSLPERVSLTVLESVMAPLRVLRRCNPGGSVRDRAISVLDRLDIANIALEPLDCLSGGQRQLCGLAQALATEPAMLLLDEPTSALDLRHQVTVMSMTRLLATAGRIVICVLHDLSQAARWADSIIVMSNGACHVQGPPDETITPAVLVDVYAVRANVERVAGYPYILVHGAADKE